MRIKYDKKLNHERMKSQNKFNFKIYLKKNKQQSKEKRLDLTHEKKQKQDEIEKKI